MPRNTRRFSYVTGEKGANRVRLFENEKGGMLYLEYRDRATGRKLRPSTNTRDRPAGKRIADDLATALHMGTKATAGPLVLGDLFDMYIEQKTPQKGASKQAHDVRARCLLEQCWGRTCDVRTLDIRDWDRFISRRRSGGLTLSNGSLTGPVRDRVVELDLRFMLAVLNWALTVRQDGAPLLARNPFRGFNVPVEHSPKQPDVTEEEFQAVTAVASQVHRLCPLFLVLAHETGHRCMAVAKLTWGDIDFHRATIRWRAENDKMGNGHTVPASSSAMLALREERRNCSTLDPALPIFPSSRDPNQAISRNLVRIWWDRLEEKANLDRKDRRGWHAFRRKFATENQHMSLKEEMALGGWLRPESLLRYIKPREEFLRAGLEARTTLRAEAARRAESNGHTERTHPGANLDEAGLAKAAR